MNVATMSTAQWYRVLLEHEVIMEENNTMEYISSRSELASPGTDWELTWRRARLKGLGSEATSFLWKLLHRILPTEERVARILPNSSENCRHCPTPTQANLEHCFFNCENTRHVGRSLLAAIRVYDPAVTPAGLLRLEFAADESTEMPIVWVTAQTLLYSWGMRQNGRVVDLMVTRTILETKINLLRETRYRDEHVVIEEILEQLL